MSRTSGRSAQETKALIVEAAAHLVRKHGMSVALSDIAAQAGVSKGGLLYHFPTKEQLMGKLISNQVAHFRREVEQAAEQEEPAPGRLARAYIQVSFAGAADEGNLQDLISLSAQLMTEPGLRAVAQADAERWRAELFDDGLDPAAVRLIVAAADGFSSGLLWGGVLNDEDLPLLRDQLLELTHPR